MLVSKEVDIYGFIEKVVVCRFCAIVLLSLVVILPLHAGNFIKLGGARAAGLSQAVISVPEAGYIQNQALTTQFDVTYIELYSSLPFAIKELGTHSIFAATPLLRGVSSVQYQYFGYKNYNENRTGIAYARQLSKKVSIGVQINWLRTAMPAPYKTKNNIVAEVGLSYRINRFLNFGAHIFNPTQSKHNSDKQETATTAIRAGIAYYPVEQIIFCLEIVQSLGFKTTFRTAVDLRVTQFINVQAGYDHNNRTISFGTGAKIKDITINMAAGYHNLLGYTPHLSIGKRF